MKTIEKYGASWCGPCHALDKTLKEFESRHPEVKVLYYDVDEIDNIEELHITNVPVLRFLDDNGNEIKRLIGAQPLTAIENELL